MMGRKRTLEEYPDVYIEHVILEVYNRFIVVKERLEEFEKSYIEEYDKYNKIMFEGEFKELYKKLTQKGYADALKKYNIEI